MKRGHANALLPQFPGECQHDGTDDESHEPERLEPAQAPDEHPDEPQANAGTGNERAQDLVAAQEHGAPQDERQDRGLRRAGQRQLQRKCKDSDVTEERNDRERTRDRRPRRCVRHATRSICDAA